MHDAPNGAIDDDRVACRRLSSPQEFCTAPRVFSDQWLRVSRSPILNNDSVLVVGFTLFVATMMVLVNLAVDILYAVVDPRVRY